MPFSTSPTLTIFKNRTLVVLLAFAGLCETSWAVTLGDLDTFTESSQKLTLRSVEASRHSLPLANSTLLNGWTREVGMEAETMPAARSATSEIASDYGLFFLAFGPGVSARTWLEYKAPEGLSLDLTLANAANCLEVMVEFSQAPFEVRLSLESMGGLSESHTFTQDRNLAQQRLEIPFALYSGTDLNKVSAIRLEISNKAGAGAPDLILSGLHLTSSPTGATIPEPSALLLVFVSVVGFARFRQRVL